LNKGSVLIFHVGVSAAKTTRIAIGLRVASLAALVGLILLLQKV
jgi:hypothetical protein